MRSVRRSTVVMSAALLVAMAPEVGAQAIFSARSAVVNLGGSAAPNDIDNTFNKAGLSVSYTSDVTSFNTYIAGNPRHALAYFGNEWFSAPGNTSATVTYDFGAVRSLDRFALWNEETSGIGLLNILGSTDGVNFATILSGLTPPDNPVGADYGATVYSFSTTSARYFRMQMSNCPQGIQTYVGCAIGEVAWRSAMDQSVVPEPSSVLLLASGLLALGGTVARRRRA